MSQNLPYNSPTKTLRFVAAGLNVMHGAVRVCTATSTTMAQRIAKALNLHTPNSRGI